MKNQTSEHKIFVCKNLIKNFGQKLGFLHLSTAGISGQ